MGEGERQETRYPVNRKQRLQKWFDGIVLPETRKTVAEWVIVAEKLAKQHGGILPGVGWLIGNRYIGLNTCLYNHPDAFAHIKQYKRECNSPDEWVRVAKSRAKKNGGFLENYKWLYRHGLSGLCQVMAKFPKKFSHIKQKHLQKTPDEWVEIAEHRAAKNGGVLENVGWLIDHGLGALAKVMTTYPKKFAHIKQDCLQKTPEEWVKVAESRAKKNGGYLENSCWLTQNGLGGLHSAMRVSPKLFAHIKQVHAILTPLEQLEKIVALAKKHQYIMPPQEWCRSHRLSGVYAFPQRHRKLFLTKFKHVSGAGHGKWVLRSSR